MERAATSPIILLIEDEEGIRSFFTKALELGGFAPVAAATAEAALNLMNEGLRPDAVLLDLAMPGMGGLGFLLQVRANPRYRDLRVAIVTGHLFIPDPVRDAAAELGVGVHHKPIDMDGLLDLTRDLIEPKRA